MQQLRGDSSVTKSFVFIHETVFFFSCFVFPITFAFWLYNFIFLLAGEDVTVRLLRGGGWKNRLKIGTGNLFIFVSMSIYIRIVAVWISRPDQEWWWCLLSGLLQCLHCGSCNFLRYCCDSISRINQLKPQEILFFMSSIKSIFNVSHGGLVFRTFQLTSQIHADEYTSKTFTDDHEMLNSTLPTIREK